MAEKSLTKQRLEMLDRLYFSLQIPELFSRDYVALMAAIVQLGALEEKVKQKTAILLGGKG